MPSPRRSLAAALAAAVAALARGGVGGRGGGPGAGGAGSVVAPVARLDTADADGRALLLPGSEDAARATASEDVPDPEAAARARRTATVEVVVRARGSGTPVAHASAWVVDDSFRRLQCDESGRAVFDVLPGETLVGGEPPEGSGLLELAYDPETDELASEANVTLAAGERGTVSVELFPSATIRGLVRGPDGEPVENFAFALVPPKGDSWGKPRLVWTSAAGRFEVTGLGRGTYMVGPVPLLDEVFPVERPTVEWGGTAELDLRLAPSREVTVRVTIVQAGTEERWPLPATVDLQRADGLGDLVSNLPPGGGSRTYGLSPVEATWALRPGPHRLQVFFQGGTRGHACWILDDWYDERAIHVEGNTDTLVVEVTSPRVERLAHVRGFISRPFTRSDSELVARPAGGNGAERPLIPSARDLGFEIWVDLDHARFERLEIVQRAEGRDTVLGEVAMQPGTQEVTVTPTGGA